LTKSIVFVRLSPTRGPIALATEPCKVIVYNPKEHYSIELLAGVVTTEELDQAKRQATEEDMTPDPDYAPDWIYEDVLDSDEMRHLLHTRGHHTSIIDEERNFGDDTADFFNDHVANGHEEALAVDDGWRIFRSEGEHHAHEEGLSGQEIRALRDYAIETYKAGDGDRTFSWEEAAKAIDELIRDSGNMLYVWEQYVRPAQRKDLLRRPGIAAVFQDT
jgi:hypothetical protein